MENEEKKTRRPYHKPQLEQVQLVAEEAVLANCKGRGSSGPNDNNCKPKVGECITKGS